MHRPQNIRLGRLTHRILLIVRQEDHILPSIAKVLFEVGGHVSNIVDATTKLPSLVEVVDPDEKRLSTAGAIRVLEIVAWRSPPSKVLRRMRRRRRSGRITLDYTS